MKGITRTQAPPIEALEEHMRKVSLSKFDYVPGYTARSKVLPVNSRVINHIAWGLVRAKLRDKAEVQPKGWFAKTFYQSINRFIDTATIRYAEATDTHLAAMASHGLMAQARQDNVPIKLEIPGTQSRTELDNLTRKAQVLQQSLQETTDYQSATQLGVHPMGQDDTAMLEQKLRVREKARNAGQVR